mgnify:CR=1 FL=1
MKRIRKSTMNDLPAMLEIFKNARAYMASHGNPNQWHDNWPSEEILISDINIGQSYIVEDDEKGILATYAYIVGVDPTYLEIDGAWLTDDPYGTIHRLASAHKERDIFSYIISEVTKNGLNMRIDTHANNDAMIRAILKNGFKYCGIISPIEGGDRNAYELIIK